MKARRVVRSSWFWVPLFVCLIRSPVAGQAPAAAARTFELSALQQAAIASDPRMRQLDLLMQQSDLRLRNIAAGHLPVIAIEGLAQYQSDVPTATLAASLTGRPLFAPPKATVDSGVRVDQRLFDTTLDAQGAVERAQRAEQQARVRTALFALRQQVNDAFFTAAALQARAGALAASVAGLDARLQEMNARVAQGTALPSDAAAIEATLLQRQLDEDELRTNREAALARLAIVTGQPVSGADILALPNLGQIVARVQQASAAARARPEYDQFARTRDRLVKQAELSSAQERPRVSAFAKVGYGRPGLNFIADEWDTYGLGGVRLQWNAWTWGTGAREREALAMGQQVVAADQDAFEKGLREATETDRAAIDRLQHALVVDDRIVTLREQVARSTQVRLQEGVVTSSEYLDRDAELLQARFARAVHQVELAQASARVLTTLGLEVR